MSDTEAAGDDTLDAAAIYDRTRIGGVAVSPDGDRAAFVASEADPDEDRTRNSVFVVPTDGSRDPHRLTRVSDAGTPVWSPDGDRLAVPMAREEDVALRVGRDDEDEEETDAADKGDEAADPEDAAADGDDGPETQVWVYDLALGGDARQVTTLDEGVQSFDWGPDGDRLVVAARDPTDDQREYLDEREDGGPVEVERTQHKFDGAGWLDDVRSYLHVVHVERRETERLDATGFPPSVGANLSPAWGPDRIAFCAYDADAEGNDDPRDETYAADVYTIAPDGSDRRRLTDGDLAVGAPTWSPDGGRLAFTGRYPENWYRPSEVFVADPDRPREDAPGVAYDSVSASLDRTLAYGFQPSWTDDETLLAVVGDEARSRFVRLHTDDDPERLPAAQNEFEGVGPADVAADGSTVACVLSRPDAGADLHAIDAAALDASPVPAAERGTETDPRRRLTAVNDDLLETYDQPVCERLTVHSGGGDEGDPAEVDVVAYRPPEFDPGTDDPGKFLLWIHGGPMAYDEPAFSLMDGYFTSRGYTVWKVNYRGSTSYGRAFSESLKGRWNSVEVADLLAAVDAAVDRGWADPERLFVGGFSQGGVNTGYLVTRREFAAAAAEHGIYDLRSSFGTDDSHNWLEADFGLPWENPERYDAASSITDVEDVATPTLLTAGENDWRCPPSQAEQFYVSLRKQGVPAKLVIYQDEHHNVGDPDRAIHRFEELEGWFREHDPARESEAEDEGDAPDEA